MPLGLGRRNLVANAFAGDLALELGEAQEHVERQPAHAGGGVERLRYRHEADAPRIEPLDDPREVGEAAGQPVDLVDHHHIDKPRLDIAHQPLQRGALHGSAREPAIVIECWQRAPAFRCLALHISLACLALRVEAVERLVETLVAALARVDRAAPCRRLHGAVSRKPKNRGPFQREPAIAVAAADRLL